MTSYLLRCTSCRESRELPMKDVEYFQKRGLAVSCGTCRGALVVDQTINKRSVVNQVVYSAANAVESVIKSAVNSAIPSPKSTPPVCECNNCGKWHRRNTYQYK